jgi:hypothetical protein
MSFDYSGDKIAILLSPHDFSTYKIIKTNPALCTSLVSPIVFSAITKALDLMKMREAESDLRWVRCLRRRVDHMGLSWQTESLELAQQLLELPIKRSLTTAKAFLESV